MQSEPIGPLDLYASLLRCAQGQARALERDDWATCLELAAQRAELVAATQRALDNGRIDNPAQAIALIQATLAADATLARTLERKRAELDESAAQYRQAVAAAAGYRAAAPPTVTGFVLDAQR